MPQDLRASEQRLEATIRILVAEVSRLRETVETLLQREDGPAELSPKEIASFLGVSVNTVRRWCRDGTLEARQPQGQKGGWRIPKSEVDRLRSSP